MPKPGQFILTGSVRFASRKLIRESLTGRIALYELLPLNITESHGEPLNSLPLEILNNPKNGLALFKRLVKQREEKSWQTRIGFFLESGGLPGVCFTRQNAIKHKKWESYLETILLRDLQLIIQTSLSYPTLRNLAAQIALQQGLPLELSDLSKQTGISAITLKKLLVAFQGLYLIREVRGLGPLKKSIYFFEDQGLAYHLMAGWKNPLMDMMRLIFANVRHQFLYHRGLDAQWFHFKTRGGASIPLICQIQGGIVGYTVCLEKQPTPSTLASARSFIKDHPQALVFIVHQGSEIRLWGDGIWSVPLYLVI
jgi:predicted AAA+ superfamily ATPase